MTILPSDRSSRISAMPLYGDGGLAQSLQDRIGADLLADAEFVAMWNEVLRRLDRHLHLAQPARDALHFLRGDHQEQVSAFMRARVTAIDAQDFDAAHKLIEQQHTLELHWTRTRVSERLSAALTLAGIADLPPSTPPTPVDS